MWRCLHWFLSGSYNLIVWLSTPIFRVWAYSGLYCQARADHISHAMAWEVLCTSILLARNSVDMSSQMTNYLVRQCSLESECLPIDEARPEQVKLNTN